MQKKTERFELRLDPETLNRVDNWRTGQSDLPSRAAAVRRLIDAGLALDESKFRPTISEKLIVGMLCDLFKQLKLDDAGFDPDLIEKATVGGHHWALEWEYGGMFEESIDEQVALEVANILQMWWNIESSYDYLSEDERARLEADSVTSRNRFMFRGFDGNVEPNHFFVAKLMIDDLGRFRHFAGRDLNSHYPSLHRHRSMLALFETMQDSVQGGQTLTATQIAELVGSTQRS